MGATVATTVLSPERVATTVTSCDAPLPFVIDGGFVLVDEPPTCETSPAVNLMTPALFPAPILKASKTPEYCSDAPKPVIAKDGAALAAKAPVVSCIRRPPVTAPVPSWLALMAVHPDGAGDGRPAAPPSALYRNTHRTRSPALMAVFVFQVNEGVQLVALVVELTAVARRTVVGNAIAYRPNSARILRAFATFIRSATNAGSGRWPALASA